LGIPVRRLKIAQHWHKLLCEHPGILFLTLPGHPVSALWDNARDLALLLGSLSKNDKYKDKVLALKQNYHLCFECIGVVACNDNLLQKK